MGTYATVIESKHRALCAHWSQARMEREMKAHLAILLATGYYAVPEDEREEFGFELLLCSFINEFIMDTVNDYAPPLEDAFYALMDSQTQAEALAWNEHEYEARYMDRAIFA